jgi:hypothetical protein
LLQKLRHARDFAPIASHDTTVGTLLAEESEKGGDRSVRFSRGAGRVPLNAVQTFPPAPVPAKKNGAGDKDGGKSTHHDANGENESDVHHSAGTEEPEG